MTLPLNDFAKTAVTPIRVDPVILSKKTFTPHHDPATANPLGDRVPPNSLHQPTRPEVEFHLSRTLAIKTSRRTASLPRVE